MQTRSPLSNIHSKTRKSIRTLDTEYLSTCEWKWAPTTAPSRADNQARDGESFFVKDQISEKCQGKNLWLEFVMLVNCLSFLRSFTEPSKVDITIFIFVRHNRMANTIIIITVLIVFCLFLRLFRRLGLHTFDRVQKLSVKKEIYCRLFVMIRFNNPKTHVSTAGYMRWSSTRFADKHSMRWRSRMCRKVQCFSFARQLSRLLKRKAIVWLKATNHRTM